MVGLPRERKRTRKFNRVGRKTKTSNNGLNKGKTKIEMKIKENASCKKNEELAEITKKEKKEQSKRECQEKRYARHTSSNAILKLFENEERRRR